MLKLGSKTDINASYKCTVRLLDDTEVLECEFQVVIFQIYILHSEWIVYYKIINDLRGKPINNLSMYSGKMVVKIIIHPVTF